MQIALPRIIAFAIFANAGLVALRSEAADAALPEMARLANALVGEWNTLEVVQHGKPIPEGAGRHGTEHVVLTGGGTALVSEGHSVGTVGRPSLVHYHLVGSGGEVQYVSHLLQNAR